MLKQKLPIFTIKSTPMNTICIEDVALYSRIEKVIDGIADRNPGKSDKWTTIDEAMSLLRIKSRTTLQKLRDESKIRVSYSGKRCVLFDGDFILIYLDDFAYETFNLK